MGDGLDYWDRPKYPACTDRKCSAVRAGIPHVVDETHREVLETMRHLRSAEWCENPICEREHFKGNGPCQWDGKPTRVRSLVLRAADNRQAWTKQRERWLIIGAAAVWVFWIVLAFSLSMAKG